MRLFFASSIFLAAAGCGGGSDEWLEATGWPPGDGGALVEDSKDAADAVADLDAPVVSDVVPDVVPDVITDSGVHLCQTQAPKDCSKGSGQGTANECFDGPSCFVGNVQKAVNGVVAANPSWFDFNNQWNCPMILAVDSFMDAVVASLVSQGRCAIRDPNAPGEEVTVKHDNAFSENFDIVASTGCARSGSAIYTGWCAPAWW